jgi:hypothetical protein
MGCLVVQINGADSPPLYLADLHASPRWVAWRTECCDQPGKYRKMPYVPRPRGGLAKVNDPATWGTFAQARSRADSLLPIDDKPKGVGIILGTVSDALGLGGIDLDTCRSPDGAIEPWATEIVDRLGSYAEVSPSGSGLKVFFHYDPADLPTLRTALKRQPGEGDGKKWARTGGDHPPAIELYLDGRYFAVTVQHHPGAPTEIRPVTAATLLWLINEAGPAFTAAKQDSDGSSAPDDRSRSAVAFRLAKELRTSGKVGTYAEMCAALRAAPSTADWCREKGDARDGRELKRIWDKTLPDGVDALIAKFNERYMVVVEAGKTVIYRPAYDPILHRKAYWRMTFTDFRNAYSNRFVASGVGANGKPICKNAAEVWLKHRERRQYLGGVMFDPSGQPAEADALNLWQGFAVDPQPGCWARMQEHIRTVICRGEADKFDYLMGWLARMVQQPAEQGEIAVVLRGAEGTGKGTLARAAIHLLGQHALAISNSKHLTGAFNAHLRDCVFLFADEAFYAGDKQHVGVLKSLITEPHLTVEAKYQNAVQMPNFLHLMMASNEEWVVPASLEARRFLVLEVSDARKNDHAYFGAIREEMEVGGYEAMLHDLLSYDLSRFNVFAFPRTAELGEQQKLSLDTTHRWWIEVLQQGYVLESKYGLSDTFSAWMPEVTTELLYKSYLGFADRRRERHPISRETLGRFMKEIGAQPDRLSDGIIGEELARVVDDDTGHAHTQGQVVRKARPGSYVLGTLGLARAAFADATGLAVEWDGAEDVQASLLPLPALSPSEPMRGAQHSAGWQAGPPPGLEDHWAAG